MTILAFGSDLNQIKLGLLQNTRNFYRFLRTVLSVIVVLKVSLGLVEPAKSHNERMHVMDKDFKDPYSVKYFLGFLLVLCLPTLPASLTWLGLLS